VIQILIGVAVSHVLWLSLVFKEDRAIAQPVSPRLPKAAARVRAQVRCSGFVVDKVALGQVVSEYFGFPCKFLFHRLLHTHHLSSGAGTVGQIVVDVSSKLSVTPPQHWLAVSGNKLLRILS
jgi:hypothetical protein